MKSIYVIVSMCILAMAPFSAAGENDSLESYLSQPLSDVQLKEDGPQKYIFICDYFYINMQGDTVRKQRVSGAYTRALPDGKVRWNDVKIAQAAGFDDPFLEEEKQDYMEGFTYRPDSKDLLNPELFTGFPPSMIDTRNLVWDTAMFEGFGWVYSDKLQLNRTYRPSEPIGEFPLAGAGTFQNKQIELTLLGISQMNGEPCALIQYRAFFNKLSISTDVISVRGGSHYWGEIWVSLKDKQIEHATLYESVIVETKLSEQQNWQSGSAFRKGTFQKVVSPAVEK